MNFQDPYSSLNPRMPVYEIVGEALRNLDDLSRSEMEDRVREALVRVGLRPEYIRRYPHAKELRRSGVMWGHPEHREKVPVVASDISGKPEVIRHDLL